MVASTKEQLTVRCNVFLTHQKPAISKILYIKNYMHNHHVEAIFGRVLIEGNITFEITYLSEKQNQHNQFYASTTYYDFIDVPEATTEMVADIKSTVDSVNLIGFDHETRTITVDMALNNIALLYNFEEKTLITELPSSYQDKFEKITINQIANVVKGCLKGVEEINIPLSKWPIKEVIKCNSMPLLENYEVNLGSVTVYGWFKIKIIYLDNNYQRQCTERFIPFNKILATPKAQKQLMPEVFITSHQIDYSLLPNKGIRLKHTTYFKASVFKAVTLDVLTESNSLNDKKESVICETLADKQSIETLIRESSEIDNDVLCKEIQEIRVGPVKFLFKQLVNNKVLIRGYVDFLVGYSEKGTENIKYLYKKGFFKTVVEVRNTTNDSKIELMAIVSFTKTHFSENRLTINSLLNIVVKVLNLKKIIVVTEINGPNLNSAEKNEVFFTYVMQHGDNLEELATRYGTTLEAIYKVNPQLTPPFENKKIRIPCEVKL